MQAKLSTSGSAGVRAEKRKGVKCEWKNCDKSHTDELNYQKAKDGSVARKNTLRSTLEEEQQQPWACRPNTRPILLVKPGGDIEVKMKSDRSGRFTEYRWEAHHLIPISQMENTSTLKHNAVLAGWDIDGVVNGMGLPTDKMDIAIHFLQRHDGGHCASYSDAIANELGELEEQYEDMCHGKEDTSSQETLAKELDSLSRHAKHMILAMRRHDKGASYWKLHNGSLEWFKDALAEYERRRAVLAGR